MRRFGSKVLFAVALVSFALIGERAGAQTYGKAPTPGDMGPPAPKDANFDQKLGSQVPLDLELSDHDGKPIKLSDVVGGKPTVLVLHYNRCPKLCNDVIRGLLDTLNAARRADPSYIAGGPFNVLFVSIDPRETTLAARKNRELFLKDYDGRSADAPGVWFLTASHGQGTDVSASERKVHQLADAVGFRYSLRFRNKEYLYNADANEWVADEGRIKLPAEPRNYDYGHSPGLTVLTPDGRVSQYLLGLKYDSAGEVVEAGRFAKMDLRIALTAASGGKIGSVFDKYVAPYCFVYDNVKGQYHLAVTRSLAVVSVLVMLPVLFIAFRTLRQVRREPALKPGEAFPTATNV